MVLAADIGITPREVIGFQRETADTVTLTIEDPEARGFSPGQFCMLYAFGIGESAISISGDPSRPGVTEHTIREVGSVTKALSSLRPGDRVGVRGPYGVGWPMDAAIGGDLVVVAGGVGLAPLRPVIRQVLGSRDRRRRRRLVDGTDRCGDGSHPPDRCRPGEDHRHGVWSRGHDALRRSRTRAARNRHRPDSRVTRAQHAMRRRRVRTLPDGPLLRMQGRPGVPVFTGRPVHGSEGGMKPTLAVFKFASCDGCQLSILDAEDHIMSIAGAIDIVEFAEATTRREPPPYTVGLVEGSITTPQDALRIREIREQCQILVTIGACATSGGIQALRNAADVDEFAAQVYASPEYLDVLATSTPISDHVKIG